jgi:hypothetical protein
VSGSALPEFVTPGVQVSVAFLMGAGEALGSGARTSSAITFACSLNLIVRSC